MDRFAGVEAYFAAQTPEARMMLAELRRLTFEAAPEAEESISYGMPAYKYRGRPFTSFGAWKNHCAIYGMDQEPHRDELAPFATAKGTIRFPLGQPLPEKLIKSLLQERIAAIDASPPRARRPRRPRLAR